MSSAAAASHQELTREHLEDLIRYYEDYIGTLEHKLSDIGYLACLQDTPTGDQATPCHRDTPSSTCHSETKQTDSPPSSPNDETTEH